MRKSSSSLRLRQAVLVLGLALAGLACERQPEVKEKGASIDERAPFAATYEIRIESKTRLDPLPSGQRMEFSSRLKAHRRPLDATSAQLILELVEPKLSLGGQAPQQETQLDAVLADLRRPFGGILRQGVLEAHLDPPSPSPVIHGLRRQIAALFQYTAPPTPETKSWKGTEWDAAGHATVGYEVAAGSSSVSWTKNAYEQALSRSIQPGIVPTKHKMEVERAIGTIVFSNGGLQSFTRDEVLRVELTPQSSLRAETGIVLERVETLAPPSSEAWAALERGLQRHAVDEPPPLQSLEALDDLRVGERTFEQVLKELDAFEAEKNPDPGAKLREEHALYQALVGLFRMDTKNVDLAVAHLQAGPSHEKLLLKSLGSASTNESLGALVRLAEDEKRPWPFRERAAFAFIRAERPGPDQLAQAERLMKIPRLRETGLLGLGTFVRRWRMLQLEEPRKRGTEVLAAELKRASGRTERAQVLLAIANAGSPELYDAVAPFQDAKEADVRDAAVQAIRLMPLEKVEPRLIELLSRSTGTDAVSVLRALGKRTSVTASTVKNVRGFLAEGMPPEVRREAVVTLLSWKDQWPEIKAVLGELAERDADARVREVAREAGLG